MFELPIVQAPMAGGPSTPKLAAAVSGAGGLGFLAAGYLTAEPLGQDIAATRALTDRPFGVNVFAAGGAPAEAEAVAAYARRLAPEAERLGVALGEPRFDDDDFDAKLELLVAEPVAVVSFTFGLPPRDAVERLRRAGSQIWQTVTNVQEARAAEALGVDALVVQGVEAGGHRGLFADEDDAQELTLLVALQLIANAVSLPLIAAGGLMTAGAVAAVLAAGAKAAQLGTAYLLTPEAGTSQPHREAVAGDAPTVLTRAFSGRTARGVVNRLHREHARHAPRAYPEIHYVTAPLRARARQAGDAEVINLWAGEAHRLALELPAAELTRRLASGAGR